MNGFVDDQGKIDSWKWPLTLLPAKVPIRRMGPHFRLLPPLELLRDPQSTHPVGCTIWDRSTAPAPQGVKSLQSRHNKVPFSHPHEPSGSRFSKNRLFGLKVAQIGNVCPFFSASESEIFPGNCTRRNCSSEHAWTCSRTRRVS